MAATMPDFANDLPGTIMGMPATHSRAVTLHDTNELTTAAIIYVGVTGNVKVKDIGGNTTTFVGVPAGSVIPLWVKQVFSTDTTASSLIAMSYK